MVKIVYIGEKNMYLSRPKMITFGTALGLAVLGILASQGFLPPLSSFAFWLVVAGFILLMLGNLLDNF